MLSQGWQGYNFYRFWVLKGKPHFLIFENFDHSSQKIKYVFGIGDRINILKNTIQKIY